MNQLTPKEQEGALLEVNLLKNFSHPNIVNYKTSFIDMGLLIIIMEYCEGNSSISYQFLVGDLSFHIKR